MPSLRDWQGRCYEGILCQQSYEGSRDKVSLDAEAGVRAHCCARKLKPYFDAHPVEVIMDQPLRQILENPNQSGRIVKWAIDLREGASELVNVVEATQNGVWLRYVDGSGEGRGDELGNLQGCEKAIPTGRGQLGSRTPNGTLVIPNDPKSHHWETPFSPVYGSDAMLPVEIHLETARVMYYDEVADEQGLRRNRHLLEGKRAAAVDNMARLGGGGESTKYYKKNPGLWAWKDLSNGGQGDGVVKPPGRKLLPILWRQGAE
ncbi:hypothetical protein LIER_33352 [Lithospermum erythrorhizon]|uniref:Uncharacterized protein n=1 Tax=Lithospermum erythrorhizon TaxID=34254 RepID=A0AAV3S067_LITER